MLKIQQVDHLIKIVQFAADNDNLPQLLDKLTYLNNFFWFESECDVYLYRDFDSDTKDFYWEAKRVMDDKIVMNGGIIYHEYDNSWGVHT